jgi:valyl-tRNA synthetase
MPYITEEIYSYLKNKDSEVLAVAPYPKVLKSFNNEENYQFIEDLKNLISSVRNVRSDFSIEPTRKLNIRIKAKDVSVKEKLNQLQNKIKALIKAESLEVSTDIEKTSTEIAVVSDLGEIFVDLQGIVDIEREIERQKKALADIEKSIKIAEGKLSNENFVNKAPPHVVEKERQLYQELKEKREKILNLIKMLESSGV